MVIFLTQNVKILFIEISPNFAGICKEKNKDLKMQGKHVRGG